MKNPLCFVLMALLFACTPSDQAADDAIVALADSLAHSYIITDGHVDLPYRMAVKGFLLTKEVLDFSERTPEGDFDYVRAREGGLDAPFMSIYVPSRYQETGGAKAYADSLIDLVDRIAAKYPNKFGRADSPEEVRQLFDEGKVALPMGMENGAPIEDDLQNVAYFQERGIRYITLTHGKDNQICDSSYDTTRTWNGLSSFGEEVVQEMNRVGIMVDISHVSDSAFYDVMEITQVPVIASHSSCRYFTPGFERNMNDDMLHLLARNGGVIQINFGSTFLDSASQVSFRAIRNSIGEAARAAQIEYGTEAFDSLAKALYESNPPQYTTVQVVADHIDHVVNLVGVDYVGFGSDFDGVGDSLPTGLKDVADYPNLIAELLKRGYSPGDIEKICYKNVFRVWEAVQAFAKTG